jgi:Tfp pilus assembly protein FimV
MVRANCANTNAEIHAPLSSHPQARKSTFNAPSPAAEGGTGCSLAPGPAEGGRAWGRCARASLARIPETRGCDARARVASAPTDRVRIPAKPDGARALQTARQRPASSRTTRKDFWRG